MSDIRYQDKIQPNIVKMHNLGVSSKALKTNLDFTQPTNFRKFLSSLFQKPDRQGRPVLSVTFALLFRNQSWLKIYSLQALYFPEFLRTQVRT